VDRRCVRSTVRNGVGERTAGSSSSFRGPEWRRRVRRPHTEVVTVDIAIAATHRWTDGAHSRGFGSVWGNGRRGRPRFSRGSSGGGAFVAHTPKSSPSTPPPPPLIGGRTVRAVEGSGRCVGERTEGSSSSFSGAGVEARETRVSKGVSDWGAAREDDELKARQPAGAHDASAAHWTKGRVAGRYCAGRRGTVRATRTRTRANPNP
jgi:hypothetical protein